MPTSAIVDTMLGAFIGQCLCAVVFVSVFWQLLHDWINPGLHRITLYWLLQTYLQTQHLSLYAVIEHLYQMNSFATLRVQHKQHWLVGDSFFMLISGNAEFCIPHMNNCKGLWKNYCCMHSYCFLNVFFCFLNNSSVALRVDVTESVIIHLMSVAVRNIFALKSA